MSAAAKTTKDLKVDLFILGHIVADLSPLHQIQKKMLSMVDTLMSLPRKQWDGCMSKYSRPIHYKLWTQFCRSYFTEMPVKQI